ncbi:MULTISPECIES: glycine cleavage system protein R [unclassified Ornithinimicrobium]|uniref:glycine cleavage system protein R n=1 Tax=unclassified Ornithinimicrobium TaxID=2615080 RepID=UPI0038521AC4
MTTLVITVVGDDRAGLVSALADAIAEHGGSWGRSQLAELAGVFAGIVTVDVPPGRAEELTAALEPLAGVLETTVREAPGPRGAAGGPGGDTGAPVLPRASYRLELVGNDRPGIVRDISGVLTAHGVSIDLLDTRTGPAPMAGGQIFEADITLRPSEQTDLTALRGALEDLAGELMVDITLETEGDLP